LSFAEAASIPLAAQTALQSLERGDQQVPGGLRGKTVFIPAGLSGTGSFAVQLAKNVFGAGKVITTLSTGKIPKIKEFMGDGTPDQIVDYTSENVNQAIGKGTVDFMFDTVGQTMSSLRLMKKGGVIVSISTLPSGSLMQKGHPDMKLWLIYMLDIMDWLYRAWTSWFGVKYSYLSLSGDTEKLDKLARWVDERKIKPVVGMQVKLSDIEGVRRGCQQIFDAKGGVGKFVIEID
jgi:NADPH:quinone reductase-like Zn-dependent oxidoreductase